YIVIDPTNTSFVHLTLHDALPIYRHALQVRHRTAHVFRERLADRAVRRERAEDELVALVVDLGRGSRRGEHRDPVALGHRARRLDRKSTRLNSSHLVISYAVFCLK